MAGDTVLLEDMTWPEVERALEDGTDTVVFGVASIEQHGHHLPLKMDTLSADAITRRMAERLDGALAAPTIRPGCSAHHMDFPGTITIPTETLMDLVAAYCRSFDRHGFDYIIPVATQGGNFAPINTVVPDVARELDASIIPFADIDELMDLMNEGLRDGGVEYQEPVIHAGAAETAIVQAVAPELVRDDERTPGYEGAVSISKLFAEGFRAISETGVLGDPGRATPEAGESILETIVDAYVERIETERTR